jgi:hypothetical protein
VGKRIGGSAGWRLKRVINFVEPVVIIAMSTGSLTSNTPTHRHTDTPIRRYADTPIRRYADTPIRFPTPVKKHLRRLQRIEEAPLLETTLAIRWLARRLEPVNNTQTESAAEVADASSTSRSRSEFLTKKSLLRCL